MLAFDFAFYPQENFRIHRLRAGIAAPQAAGDGSEQEQRKCRDDQQPGEIDEVLRPENQSEDVELARRQVEQNRLALVPSQPRRAVEHQLRDEYQRPAPARERAGDGARVDFLADLVKILVVAPLTVRRNRGERNHLVVSCHGAIAEPVRLTSAWRVLPQLPQRQAPALRRALAETAPRRPGCTRTPPADAPWLHQGNP